MLTRLLSGTAAALAAAGMAAAQQPATRIQLLPSSGPPPLTRPATRMTVQADKAADKPVPPATPAAPNSPPAAQPLGTPAPLPSNGTNVEAAPVPAAGPSTTLLTTAPGYANGGDPCCPTECAPACCVPCGPPGKFWIDAGYVFWSTSGQRIPPLVTSVPDNFPRTQAGNLGQPGTRVLFGGGAVDDNYRSGFYLRGGMWFDECQTCGIQGNFFYLGDEGTNYSVGGPGLPIVSRPFTNVITGQPDTELVSFPNVLSGTVSVNTNTSVIGGGPSFVKNLCCGPCGRIDLLLGYQYFQLDDEVVIRENLTSLPGQTSVAEGTRFLIEDRFQTTNRFHGGLIGVQGERRFGRGYVGYNAAISLGVNRQTTTISGSTTIIPPSQTTRTTFAGGLLTQPSNIGRYTRDEFAVMPQLGLRVGYQLTERLRAYVGYDLTYLSNVARAGEQIDLRVNPTQLPPRTNVTGPALPAFTPRTNDFFMQGIRVGVELRF